MSEPRTESVPIRSSPPEKPKPAIVSHEAMNISLRADLNRAEATVESLRAQLKEAQELNEELWEAKITISDLREKVDVLQNENADLKRILEDARIAEQGLINEIKQLKKRRSVSKDTSQESRPPIGFSL